MSRFLPPLVATLLIAVVLSRLPLPDLLSLPGIPLFQARETLQDRSPLVVRSVQALSRLETVAFTEQQVIEGRKEWGIAPTWLAGDKLLFVAHGEVIAGVDLSQVQPEHLRLEANRAYVELPRPEIFHVRLDNENSRVLDRSVGWLNKSDVQLESMVRRHAESRLRAAAMNEGILQQAQRNAQSEVRRLLFGLGADDVVFL